MEKFESVKVEIVDFSKNYDPNQKCSVTFTGFETMAQARAFADWYSGSGEQDAAYWLEEHSDLSSANAGVSVVEGNNLSVELKLHYKND